jgi:hypothetical protein
MTTYDIYALPANDLEALRPVVETILSITLVPHDSLYLGEYYLGRLNDEEYQLRKNLDPIDGEPVERNLPTTAILLYVNRTQRAPEIEKALITIALEPHCYLDSAEHLWVRSWGTFRWGCCDRG